jgi:hypothetical protein
VTRAVTLEEAAAVLPRGSVDVAAPLLPGAAGADGAALSAAAASPSATPSPLPLGELQAFT